MECFVGTHAASARLRVVRASRLRDLARQFAQAHGGGVGSGASAASAEVRFYNRNMLGGLITQRVRGS